MKKIQNIQSSKRLHTVSKFLLTFSMLTLLSACSGGGADVVPLPNTNTDTNTPTNYAGPPPTTDDIQRFKLNVWDNLVADNRCGACHVENDQDPQFVRSDDINLAYQAAGPAVNLNSPGESLMVTKVAGGHNCWLTNDQACADIIKGYISDWAGSALNGEGSSIDLIAPPIKEPGASKNFPADSAGFAATVYPVLTQYCASCHTDTSLTPQSPYFASSDVESSYAAAQSKINLDTSADSRLVIRLRSEFHNCWSDCQTNADEMTAAIDAFAAGIPLTSLDPSLLASKALLLTDGILANTGGRHEANLIAKWEFKAGSGTTAFDTSGVDPAMDLTLSGDVSWVGGWGIQIVDGKAQASTTTSKKLFDQMASTGEYTIEAWVTPANVTQEGPARILSYSGGSTIRNFTLGQTLYNYNFLNRSSNTDANGDPAVNTPDADEVLQAALQHVAITFNPTTGRKIFVDGVLVSEDDENPGGSLAEWDDTFAFVVGNEVSNDYLWQGALRMVAIHNRILTEEQIIDNFKVGVGEKFLLLFSISELIDLPDSYVVYEVSQFDSFSYLFNKPFFINLDSAVIPSNIDLEKIRIGINGREAAVGQAYRNIDIVLGSAYTAAEGQTLSGLGGIIALEKGPTADEFFLTFEKVGAQTNVVVEPDPPPLPPATDIDPMSDIGLRNFEEINATLSEITSVPMNHTDVTSTFNIVKQGLPTLEDINTFASAQQMAITQMAIEYCSALVEDNGLRSVYFSGFNFDATPSSAFNITGRDLIIDSLLLKVLNSNVSTQPDTVGVKAELNNLIDRLTTCGNNCAADRTKTVVKATCAAAVGNASMLLQ